MQASQTLQVQPWLHNGHPLLSLGPGSDITQFVPLPVCHPGHPTFQPVSLSLGALDRLLSIIVPINSPLIINPEGAIRDYTSKCFADGGQNYLCDATAQALLGDWAKNEDYRKIIMEVVKINLDLAWPYNYKAVDILSVMPESAMLENHDKLKALSETPNSERGAAELKKIVKPLLEKADAAKKKKDDEEAEEIQKAIIGMWGGLWANNGQVPGNLNQAGWHGYQYPWNGAPGVAAQAVSEWKGKAPDGWTGWVCHPVPMPNPGPTIFGWPRAI